MTAVVMFMPMLMLVIAETYGGALSDTNGLPVAEAVMRRYGRHG